MILNILIPALLLFPYLVVMIRIYLGWRSLRLPEASGYEPTVSILVAARNEAQHLPHLLRDFQQLDYPREKLEILIADDHSQDETASLAASSPGVRLLQADTASISFLGKKEALKALAKEASGEILLFTDADCRVKPGWVKAMITPFKQADIHMVAGPVRLTGNAMMELEFYSLAISTGGSIGAGIPLMCNGASLAFRRSTWGSLVDDLPASHLASGDDVFMMMTLIRKIGAHAITWCACREAIVNTPAPATLKDFLLQRIRWAGKSGHYTYRPSQWVALVVLFTNIVFALGFAFITSGIFTPWLTLFLIKSLPDFLLLWEATGFYQKRRLLWLFIPLQIIYPFYVGAIAVGTLLVKPVWKGRPVR